jgi:ubiquinone/menaquinone biosynthesis C-methylase UbiE
MTDLNPQAKQMADESMVRTLAAQIEAIWPQEQAFLDRYALSSGAGKRVIDVGCGTGEFSVRLAERYPQAAILGIDVLPGSIEHARARHRAFAPRLQFEVGDAFAIAHPSASFDLAVCRHVTQAVPHPERVIAELTRVTRPGGWVHVLSEDYGMLHMMSGPLDSDELWRAGPIEYTERTGSNARIGRKTWTLLKHAGLSELRVDYVIVDTLRVPRETFANILIAWRDGYVEPLAEGGRFNAAQFRALFDQVIAGIRDPDQYAVWFIPIVSGRKR